MSDYRNDETARWDAQQVRRDAGRRTEQQTPHRRRRRRRRFSGVQYTLFILVVSAILAGIGWLLLNDLCAFNKKAVTATVEITSEDDIGSVAAKLKDDGLIEYKWFFRLFASFAHAQDKIGIGTYELNTDMDYRALIAAMHNASGGLNGETVKVTIPEGYTVSQIIALLAKDGVNTEAALTDAAENGTFSYDYISTETGSISRLEGYLFPDTYEFYVNEKPAAALNRLIKNFDSKMDANLLAEVKKSGYSLSEIVTIASLIEKETSGTDQTRISSVIYNRLKDKGSHGTYGMLGIDASLLYALPDHAGAITKADKETDSPYNLYKNAGLPPTPIANPGLTAIKAALNPDATDYYYYALGKDGTHHFFETYDEHVNFLNSSEYAG
jgi:conserved hypothetical protein, YceG family